MHVIGVTGGIGSGKSTVCGILAELGAVVIDADAVSRQLTAVNGYAIPLIQAEFGQSAIAEDGSMDRAYMRELVFNNSELKLRLEKILHPLITAATQKREFDAKASGVKLIVHDVPLLVESFGHWRDRLDEVWVVDCSEETQIQRVMSRSGLSRQTVGQIISHQATRAERLAVADRVLLNDGKTPEDLRHEVAMAVKRFGL